MTLYDWIYLAATPLALPYLGYRRLARGKYRESAPAMLGRGPQWAKPTSYPGGSVWLHAVSAGEVTAAKAVAPELRRAFPDWPLVASTTTETGQAAARKRLDEAEEVFYFPLDFSWNVRKFLDRYNPRVVTLLEAELWPNFLTQAAQRGTKIFLLNGRMSARSHRRYLKARRLLAGPLSRIGAFCMQSQGDADRLEEVLGSRERIFVTGDCKFDADFPTLDPGERERWLRRLGIEPTRPVVVIGSTHDGEEQVALDAFDEARRTHPALALILAPRHPERFGAAADLLRERGLRFRRASDESGAQSESPDVVLLDVMGQLAKAYGLGAVGVVAGSFAPIGGHNLLEVAAHSIPVLYGPHMHRQPDMLRIVGEGGGGIQIQPQDLGKTISELLTDNDRRAEIGQKARASLDENRGCVRRMVEIMKQTMEAGETSPQ